MPANPHLVSTAVLLSHWLIVIALSARVIARRLPVGVSLAWLVLLCSVPFAGAAAYMLFGGKHLDRLWFARQAKARRDAQPGLAALIQASSPPSGTPGLGVYPQALRVLGAPALHGNRLQLLEDHLSVFDALVREIDSATRHCRLAFYIWHDAGEVERVHQALLQARSRGVQCKVLLDAIGSKPFLGSRRCADLVRAGIEVAAALTPSLGRRADLRYHRKIALIDDRVAYVGSQNLVDPRFFKLDSGVGQWVDAVARIEGPAVLWLSQIFEMDWSAESGDAFAAPSAMPAPLHGDVLVQAVPSGPAPRPEAIHRLLLTAIYSARHTLPLTTPYFVPDESVLSALISAAQGGVRVTLIVPARNDSFLVRHASEANYDELLAAGVRIALFEGGLLHTKSMLIDDTMSIFGSVNFDMRSFWLNFEISLLVYSTEFTSRINELQQGYLGKSVLIDADRWSKRPIIRRALGNTLRLLGPLL